MASESVRSEHRVEPSQRPAPARKPVPARPAPRKLPPWKVLLHNDDVNEMEYVVQTITMLTPLSDRQAAARMLEAHLRGLALMLVTHRELAELYRQQFASRRLTVTIEPQPG